MGRVLRVLAPVGLLLLLCSCSTNHTSQRSVLIVGDSVAAQAAQPLIHLAPAGVTVTVDAVQPGTAPCDWNHGLTVPGGKTFPDFATILDTVRPQDVVFVFTGNPGLSGPSAGCVDASSAYSLSELLHSYDVSLNEMANRAVKSGATVFFETPPPRNPAVAVGYDPVAKVNRGFQGSPYMVAFYQSLVANAKNPQWRYDDRAASSVSTPELAWRLDLTCEPWDVKRCDDGKVQVRVGGEDAVHLDEKGCGAVRFALGVEEAVLGRDALPDPSSVSSTVSDYGGCQ